MVQPCAGGTQIENGGWGYGGVGLGRIFTGGYPYPCDAALMVDSG